MRMLSYFWRLLGSSLLILCLISLLSCGGAKATLKDELIKLEKLCLEKLEADPIKVTSDISLAAFCWCFVKEARPKDECMEEASNSIIGDK